MRQNQVVCLRRRPLDQRRGVTIVEFAIVAPLFFLVVLGIFEFGRAMMVHGLLVGAAQQGARVGAMHTAQATDVSAAVNSYLTSAGISGATTVVTPDPPANANPGQDVKVTVSIGYMQVSWLPAPKYLKTVTLSSTAIVQRESGQ